MEKANTITTRVALRTSSIEGGRGGGRREAYGVNISERGSRTTDAPNNIPTRHKLGVPRVSQKIGNRQKVN